MSIMVEISPGELFDKITILEIKQEQIKDIDKLKNINFECNKLQKSRDEVINNIDWELLTNILQLEKSLKEVNYELWKIEDDIRSCESIRNFDETFIGLARYVYFTNDKRSSIKRKINYLLGSSMIEEKSYKN